MLLAAAAPNTALTNASTGCSSVLGQCPAQWLQSVTLCDHFSQQQSIDSRVFSNHVASKTAMLVVVVVGV
jgi:hypothetical protein